MRSPWTYSSEPRTQITSTSTGTTLAAARPAEAHRLDQRRGLQGHDDPLRGRSRKEERATRGADVPQPGAPAGGVIGRVLRSLLDAAAARAEAGAEEVSRDPAHVCDVGAGVGRRAAAGDGVPQTRLAAADARHLLPRAHRQPWRAGWDGEDAGAAGEAVGRQRPAETPRAGRTTLPALRHPATAAILRSAVVRSGHWLLASCGQLDARRYAAAFAPEPFFNDAGGLVRVIRLDPLVDFLLERCHLPPLFCHSRPPRHFGRREPRRHIVSNSCSRSRPVSTPSTSSRPSSPS